MTPESESSIIIDLFYSMPKLETDFLNYKAERTLEIVKYF